MANEEVVGTVRQINSPEGLHDIESPLLVPENEYRVAGLHVKSASGSSIIKFNETTEGTGGRVEYNSKGNMSIESLEKHVNIEAKKGIQLKPTTNIIFDSSRRIFNNKGNEVHLQFVFDDYDEAATGQHPGDDEEYAELKLEARNIDFRCFDHGGVAIQPCGTDGNNFENKIKFESSRVSPLGTQNPSYASEGGKGLEFGTFNNEHSSLFTFDYRFNRDGKVYAATRETPVTEDGKTDYPTQEDDFKDIIEEKKSATWNQIVAAGRECTFVVSKSGKITGHKGMIVNNMYIPIYLDPNTDKIYFAEADLDVVYDENGTEVVFDENWTKANVYKDSAHTTLVDASSKLFLKDTQNNFWIADVNSSSQLKSYTSSDHDLVPEGMVLPAGTVLSSYVKINAGTIYNTAENPILLALKGIITDETITTYSDFASAVKNAFGW